MPAHQLVYVDSLPEMPTINTEDQQKLSQIMTDLSSIGTMRSGAHLEKLESFPEGVMSIRLNDTRRILLFTFSEGGVTYYVPLEAHNHDYAKAARKYNNTQGGILATLLAINKKPLTIAAQKLKMDIIEAAQPTAAEQPQQATHSSVMQQLQPQQPHLYVTDTGDNVYRLNAQQAHAVTALKKTETIVISGPPHTGKTLALNTMLQTNSVGSQRILYLTSSPSSATIVLSNCTQPKSVLPRTHQQLELEMEEKKEAESEVIEEDLKPLLEISSFEAFFKARLPEATKIVGMDQFIAFCNEKNFDANLNKNNKQKKWVNDYAILRHIALLQFIHKQDFNRFWNNSGENTLVQNKEQRGIMFNRFTQYKTWLQQENYVDLSLLTTDPELNSLTANDDVRQSNIICDDTEQMPPVILMSMAACANRDRRKFIVAVDTDVMGELPLEYLRKLSNSAEVKLTTSYRSTAVIACTNSMRTIEAVLCGNQPQQLEEPADSITDIGKTQSFELPRDKWQKSLLKHYQEIAHVTAQNAAIVVFSQTDKEALLIQNDQLCVLTVDEAQGSIFDTVILCQPFTTDFMTALVKCTAIENDTFTLKSESSKAAQYAARNMMEKIIAASTLAAKSIVIAQSPLPKKDKQQPYLEKLLQDLIPAATPQPAITATQQAEIQQQQQMQQQAWQTFEALLTFEQPSSALSPAQLKVTDELKQAFFEWINTQPNEAQLHKERRFINEIEQRNQQARRLLDAATTRILQLDSKTAKEDPKTKTLYDAYVHMIKVPEPLSFEEYANIVMQDYETRAREQQEYKQKWLADRRERDKNQKSAEQNRRRQAIEAERKQRKEKEKQKFRQSFNKEIMANVSHDLGPVQLHSLPMMDIIAHCKPLACPCCRVDPVENIKSIYDLCSQLPEDFDPIKDIEQAPNTTCSVAALPPEARASLQAIKDFSNSGVAGAKRHLIAFIEAAEPTAESNPTVKTQLDFIKNKLQPLIDCNAEEKKKKKPGKK